ncbi:glutamate receptor ionotropic, kainate 3 [Trichonephila inaurata madagascariensis]|uniref:Glutamate receptor ionotropic, kainate 3 n=1 Tax=Trichonephila inaurata madagascariensis TaxID=2747483 RepID=A0A8X6YU03_9ARAC|nr:glutamate receptor ionotropic, kainate 3 [Trichonephila inaurata madagascariensis]
MIKKSDDQTKGSNAEQYEGFCVDLLKEMSRILGFRYELRLVRDGSYGSRNSRGHWNGMVRELIDRVNIYFDFFSIFSSDINCFYCFD